MARRRDNFWNEKAPRYRKFYGAKERALAEFRGYREPDDLSEFSHENLGDVIGSTLKKMGLKERFDEDQVKAAWREIVGDFVAQNSQPVGMNRKVLIIQVLQPAVHYTLERMKGQILAKMQARFGAERVKNVQFRIG